MNKKNFGIASGSAKFLLLSQIVLHTCRHGLGFFVFEFSQGRGRGSNFIDFKFFEKLALLH